jgi:hypothetical protein
VIPSLRNSSIYLFSAIASLAVVSIYATAIFSQSLNIPFRDDFQDILIFVVEFHAASGIRDSMRVLVEQHADHLTYASRVFYYLIFMLEGEVNFRTMVVVSHLGVLFLSCLFYSQIDVISPLKPVFFVCLFLLLLHPRAYGLLIWPMATFAFFFAFAYPLATFALLKNPAGYRYPLAILCAVLATFTMSMGQFVWVLGLLFLWIERHVLGGRYRGYLFGWIMAALATMVLFYSYFSPQFQMSDLLGYVLENPIHSLQVYVTMLGSGLGFGHVPLSQVLGVASLLASVFFLFQGFRGELKPLHYFLLFNLASIAAIVMGRAYAAAFFEMTVGEIALKPRYTFASLMLWLTLFVLWLNSVKAVSLLRVVSVLAIAMFYNAACYQVFYPQFEQHRKQRLGYFNSVGVADSIAWPTQAILKKAEDAGVYVQPQRPYKPR